MSLEGKNALITGSTSGIGLAIAKSLAAAGANVVLNGFGDANEIEQTVERLKSDNNVQAHYDPADMRQPEQIASMISKAEHELGSIDILVNNAGIQFVAPVDEFPEDKWDAILAINLSSAFHTTKAVLPGMKERGWGRILNVASAHGLVASPFKSAYVTAKHGVVGLTKTVALEVAEQGITCNSICPGYVLTPLVKSQIPDTAKARGISEEAVVRDVLLAAQATKEFVTTEQIGGLTVFLCSDSAASITGIALPIDGGWTAH